MTSPVYVDKADVVATLRARDLHVRADWVDRELPPFIDIAKNHALFQTLGIDPAALPRSDGGSEQPAPGSG